MPKVLITGMSGTGKSTALQVLGSRGHRTVDTDTDRWSRWVTLPDGTSDWVWREQAITELLASHGQGSLFIADCKTNQGQFYPLFDHIVLLSAHHSDRQGRPAVGGTHLTLAQPGPDSPLSSPR